MSVYGDQAERDAELQERQNLTGADSDKPGVQGQSGHHNTAKDILGRERAAAAGKMDAAKANGPSSGIADRLAAVGRVAGLGARKDLQDKEKDSGFYKNLSAKEKDGPLGNIVKRLPKGSLRRRVAMASLLAGAVGGGGGFALLGVISGPFQFIHAARLLDSINLLPGQEQQEMGLMRVARYIKYYKSGEPEMTRMGVLGNHLANKTKFSEKFANNGVETAYGAAFGFATGQILDPSKLSGDSFADLKDRSPTGLQEHLRKHGIESEIRGDKVFVDTTQKGFGYKKNKIIMKEAVKGAGYSRLTGAMVVRYASIRGGFYGWFHPFKKLDAKLLRKADAQIEFRKQRYQKIRNGVKPPSFTAGAQDGQEGEQGNKANQQSDEVNDFLEEQKEAIKDIGENKPGAFEKFRTSIYFRLTGGIAALIGIVCLAQAISDAIDVNNKSNVEEPLKNVGADIQGIGAQVESGVDLDGQTEQLHWRQDLMYDKKTQTSFFDNEPLNVTMGRGPAGAKMPEEAKPKTDGNVIGLWLARFPNVRQVCDFVNGWGGTILLTGIALLSGPVSAIVGAIVGIIAGPYLIDYIASMLSASQIKDVAGGVYGAYGMFGTRLMGNDAMIFSGALPVKDSVAVQFEQEVRDTEQREFQSKSLAYRLFDANDPKSLFSQFIDQQVPDPAANTQRYATGMLNIGKTFGSLLAKPLFASVGAQAAVDTNYDYGFKRVLFDDKELEDKRFEIPGENSKLVVPILDTRPDLIERAKICFNMVIEKQPYDPANPADTRQVWAIQAPVSGSSPFYKDIEAPENNCYDQSLEWLRVRFFIFYSLITNSAACWEGEPQACKDAGFRTAAETQTAL